MALKTPEPQQIPHRILWSTMLFAFAIWLPVIIVPPMEEIFTGQLHFNDIQISILFNGPILLMAICSIPGGLLADSMGVKKTAGIGGIIIVAGTILRSTSTEFAPLLAYTLIYGVGMGISFPNIPKLVRQWHGPERAHGTIAIISTAILIAAGLGLAVTVPLVYRLTGSVSRVFLIFAFIPVISTAVWWIFVKDPPGQDTSAGQTFKSLKEVTRNKTIWLASLLFLLHNYFFYTWAGWVPAYLTNLGFSSNISGVVVSVALWAGIPVVSFIPRLSRRLGRRKPFLWIPSAVLIPLSYLILRVNMPASWALMTVVGAAAASRFTTILTLPGDIARPEQTGAAAGVIFSVGYMGAVVGPIVSGQFVQSGGDYSLVFYVLTGVSLATMILAMMIPETGPGRVLKGKS